MDTETNIRQAIARINRALILLLDEIQDKDIKETYFKLTDCEGKLWAKLRTLESERLNNTLKD